MALTASWKRQREFGADITINPGRRMWYKRLRAAGCDIYIEATGRLPVWRCGVTEK